MQPFGALPAWWNGRHDALKTRCRKACEFDSHRGHMNNLLVRVKTGRNPKLDDDAVVRECMAALIEQHPAIEGYVFERTGPEVIQILMWGNFKVKE